MRTGNVTKNVYHILINTFKKNVQSVFDVVDLRVNVRRKHSPHSLSLPLITVSEIAIALCGRLSVHFSLHCSQHRLIIHSVLTGLTNIVEDKAGINHMGQVIHVYVHRPSKSSKSGLETTKSTLNDHTCPTQR